MPASPELTTLTALAQALSHPAELSQSLDAALATVAELLGLETGWVWLLDEATDEPRLAAARALPPALQGQPKAMRGDCYCLSTFRAGDLRGAANVNVVWCSRLEKVVDLGEDEGTANLRCHASVPLTVGERHLGMLNVASRDWRVLTDDELNLLTTAGALVSLAVERARLEVEGARAKAAEERNRLAREIHDTLAQSLAALTMQLEAVDARAASLSDARLTQTVGRALALSRSTLEEARRSVLDLRDSPLEGRRLPEALRSLAAETGRTTATRVRVRFESHGIELDSNLPAAVEAGLYRIAQQALANITRHASASRALIHLSREPEGLRLRIEDDGNGFDPSAVPVGRFGLVGMNERARLLGGTFRVDSSPAGGTGIDVVVPLQPSPPSGVVTPA